MRVALLAGAAMLSIGASTVAAQPASARSIALGVTVSGDVSRGLVRSYARTVGHQPKIVMWYQSWSEPLYYSSQRSAFAGSGSTPMITWAPARAGRGLSLRRIADGAYDGYVRQAARSAKAWGGPLLIRFGHEMNLPGIEWGPGHAGNTPWSYVIAWRHVVSVFRKEGATNVRWVWSPNVDCAGRCPFQRFYPGDRWVDWVGLDGYNYGPVDHVRWMSLAQVFGHSYDVLARLSHRPIMIAETGSTERGGDKAAWIAQGLLRDVPRRLPRVRAVMWFDRKKETDWRVNSSRFALAAYRSVAASPLYGGPGATVPFVHPISAHRSGGRVVFSYLHVAALRDRVELRAGRRVVRSRVRAGAVVARSADPLQRGALSFRSRAARGGRLRLCVRGRGAHGRPSAWSCARVRGR